VVHHSLDHERSLQQVVLTVGVLFRNPQAELVSLADLASFDQIEQQGFIYVALPGTDAYAHGRQVQRFFGISH
jgi:hypothetical protein